MIKRYKGTKMYSIACFIAFAIVAAICNAMLWPHKDWVGLSAVNATFAAGFIDAYRHLNLTYELYDNKLVVYRNNKQVKMICFCNATKFLCWGWMHVPLCWKGFALSDGHTNIVIRHIDSKEYKDLWIRLYDLVEAQAKYCHPDAKAKETIAQLKEERFSNE